MIKSYRDKRTERFSCGEFVKQFERFEVAAERKLALLNGAESLAALGKVSGGNHLEALKRDRRGQHSIRINDQWRICFIWNANEKCAEQVEIADYH
jgi:proteic killer suppression protein